MTERPYTTGLFLLRCCELDLSLFDYGTVVDMLIERGNDAEEYDYVAGQQDFDRF